VPKKIVLTDAQAEAIYYIHSIFGFGASGLFAPREIYPARTNTDSAGRRTITNLVKKGLIEKVPHIDDGQPCVMEGGKLYRLRLTDEALNAFQEYARKCDYEFPWLR
jgi:DNA-binding MarR family transcriptional regulator